MREVAIKSEEQQASRALERSRESSKQRTQAMNGLRAMLAEFGVVAAQGARGFAELTARLKSDESGLPETLVGALRVVLAQFDALTPAIAALEDRIKAIVTRGFFFNSSLEGGLDLLSYPGPIAGEGPPLQPEAP